MTIGSKVIKAIWPEDGAVISPIFMLVKRNAHPLAQEIANLLLSKEVGEILSHKGLFPSLHVQVDNRLSSENEFRWLGWDFIKENDLGKLIPKLNDWFQSGVLKK